MPEDEQQSAKASRRRPLLTGREVTSQLRMLQRLGLDPKRLRLDPDVFEVIFNNNGIAEPAAPDEPNEIDATLKKWRALRRSGNQ